MILSGDNENASIYLTKLSKFVRLILENTESNRVSLESELSLVESYIQMEELRFKGRIEYEITVDQSVETDNAYLPPMVLQPFVENAIWHGIMPKENGGTVTVSVEQRESNICCTIDDNGIGREVSKQNKFSGEAATHQSKGIHLTQSRLDLDNILYKRNATVETKDKRDAQGKSLGTIVVLTFKEY
jgi:LytS/YehU family sensor histidine kinase